MAAACGMHAAMHEQCMSNTSPNCAAGNVLPAEPMLRFLTALPVEATDERYAARAPPSQQHEEAAEIRGRVGTCSRRHEYLVCLRRL